MTDKHGHAIGHGCARPEPSSHATRAGPGPPGFTFTPASRDGPPGRYGTWILRTPGDGPDLRVTLDPIDTGPCDHRYQSTGHDPGVKLRHLTQVRHATCTSPICRRPAAQCDFEHNVPYEAGGRTCLCNAGPKCRHDHRLKQHPKWTGRPAPRRDLPLDHPGRAHLHHRTHPLPHLRGPPGERADTYALLVGGGRRSSRAGRPRCRRRRWPRHPRGPARAGGGRDRAGSRPVLEG